MRQIFFQTQKIEEEFLSIHPMTLAIMDFASEKAWDLSKDFLFLTSIVREQKITPNDTHYLQPPPYRFVDAAILRKGGIEKTEELRTEINSHYCYDPKRMELDVIPILDHGTAPHLHFQVCPETIQR